MDKVIRTLSPHLMTVSCSHSIPHNERLEERESTTGPIREPVESLNGLLRGGQELEELTPGSSTESDIPRQRCNLVEISMLLYNFKFAFYWLTPVGNIFKLILFP